MKDHVVQRLHRGVFWQVTFVEERDAILSHIEFENLNTYFYCPKEDPYHRLDWKTLIQKKKEKPQRIHSKM